jgi:hypothetical protein
MKKALVATCVVAMTAFVTTNASADPAATARANAYGVNVGGNLLGDVVERTPEVTSVLPPGGLVSDDIITVPVEPVVVNGTGVVVAETSAESTIVPFMRGGQGGLTGDGGGGGDGGGTAGLQELINQLLGGGTGAVPSGVVGAQQADDAGTFQTQQVPGLPEGGGGTPLDSLLEAILGGGGGQDAEELAADTTIDVPVANARGFARIDDLNLVIEEGADFGNLPQEVVTLLLEALLEIDAVSAEVVAVCSANQVLFETAASVVALNDEGIEAIDELLRTVGDLLSGILDIEVGETGVTADGQGIFVNALHITVLGGDPTGGVVPGTEQLDPDTQEPIPGTGFPEVTPTNEALLDIVLGHAEASSVACAPPPAPPSSLVPTGDARPSLPRTGGLGVLPGVLGVGLLGGAVAAGRLALRSRGNGDSL